MTRSLIGLDIGTSAVRAAEVRSSDPAVITRFAQVSLPAGAVIAGEIVDPDTVGDALKDLWRRGGFRSKRASVAVANQNVIVRTIDVPRLEDAELRSALRFQVADIIPIPIEDALLDHLVLDEFPSEGEGTSTLRLLVVAAHKDMVGRLMHAVTAAGLEPDAVDLAPLASVRTFTYPAPPVIDEGAEAIVDIGAGMTTIVVHASGTPRFARILAGGGNDITAALVTRLGVSVEEADAQKMTLGLAPEGSATEGAGAIIEERASAAIDDVRKSLDYYTSQPGERAVARLILTGGGAQLPGLVGRLAAAIHVPVVSGRVLDHVAGGDLGLSDEQLAQMAAVSAVAVGLALEDR